MKVNDVALKATKSSKPSSSSKNKSSKQTPSSQPKKEKEVVQPSEEPSSSSSDDEDNGEDFKRIDDMALFMKKYHKGLKNNGFKVVPRKFPNKKKRTCYNCGGTDHFIAKCPHEIKAPKYKKDFTKVEKYDNKKKYKRFGEAHIGHEWDSTKESSEEDEKVATIAIHKPSPTPRLFTNLTDEDDQHFPHICLMAKGEKVQSKSKPTPLYASDVSSELSESSGEDISSDDEEFEKITKNLDSKTKVFIQKLLEDLDEARAELATRDDDLIAQEELYIATKEAQALEKSEMNLLRKALAKEQEEHASTRKAHVALNEMHCVLDKKHKEIELQYNLLWESTSHLPKATSTSNASTSQGCDKCSHIDINAMSTNLANMKAMEKEIARLNELINQKCNQDNKLSSGKVNQQERPLYKDGRPPHIKDGLGHIKGNKTNGRKVMNGVECVKLVSKGKIGTEGTAKSAGHMPSRAAQPAATYRPSGSAAFRSGSAAPVYRQRGSAAVRRGSAAPPMKGKSSSSSIAHEQHKKLAFKPKQVKKVMREEPKAKNIIWATPNKYSYRPKIQTPRPSLTSCFVLQHNSKGEVYAKYVGNERNIYINASIWVPKILVTNLKAPKSIWGPKSSH